MRKYYYSVEIITERSVKRRGKCTKICQISIGSTVLVMFHELRFGHITQSMEIVLWLDGRFFSLFFCHSSHFILRQVSDICGSDNVVANVRQTKVNGRTPDDKLMPFLDGACHFSIRMWLLMQLGANSFSFRCIDPTDWPSRSLRRSTLRFFAAKRISKLETFSSGGVYQTFYDLDDKNGSWRELINLIAELE